jgi:beta-N-acetylhexosaminidase
VASAGPWDPTAVSDLDDFLADAIARRVFPGAVVAFGRSRGPVFARAHGALTYDEGVPRATTRTRYEYASLTKVVVTTTLLMRLVEEGRVSLDDFAAVHLPEYGAAGKDRVTVRHLLTHSAGHAAYPATPVSRFTTARALREAVFETPPLYEPGREMRYGSIGALVLGWLVERVHGRGLRDLARHLVSAPLGMASTAYSPVSSTPGSAVAPGGFDEVLGRGMLVGETNDAPTAVLGGASGASGLFGDAGDLARFARTLLRGGRVGSRRFLRAETVRLFTTVSDPAVTDARALGWDTRSPTGYTVGGRSCGPRSYGHTGDTGSSLWIDPDADFFVVLLSNRGYPTRRNREHVHVRPVVTDLAWRALEPVARSAPPACR